MYSYSLGETNQVFGNILKNSLPETGWNWLENEVAKLESGKVTSFGAAFVMMPRKTGKEPITVSSTDITALLQVHPRLHIRGWPADRLSRTYLLINLPSENEAEYINAIESLFLTAEINELVALHGALPLLAYPARWKARCAEGIRSNIAQVLEAIMCDNPYPSEQLDPLAWNQLVLKAIFTEKPLMRIIGLRERANGSLAHSISDFAHERWAAHRTVNPLVWICVENYIDEGILNDIRRLANSTNSAEQKAAALLCAGTDYPPAKALLETIPRLRQILAEGVTWNTFAAENESTRV